MTTTQQALATLRQAVRGIRFATPSDEAAWIALVLTVVARELGLFAGPAPLFLISGDAGVGKTSLATITGLVTRGEAPWTAVEYVDERFITGVASSGTPLVFFDNVGPRWGPPALLAALTADVWHGRIAGRVTRAVAPLRTTWMAATSSSVTDLAPDIQRRIACIRLVPGGGEVDILRHAREAGHVAKEAAIALLDARSAAAKADVAPWGSYDRWNDVVRRALLVAPLPDVITARAAAKLPAAPLEGVDERVDGGAERGPEVRPRDRSGEGLKPAGLGGSLGDQANGVRVCADRGREDDRGDDLRVESHLSKSDSGLGKVSLRHGQRRSSSLRHATASHGAPPLTIPEDVERWVTERATDMCVRRESVLRALVSMAEEADAALVEGVERAEADIEVALARERVVIARARERVAKAEVISRARELAECPCDACRERGAQG